MKRRDFITSGLMATPSLMLAQAVASGPKIKVVPAQADRLSETHSLGFSRMAFKVSSAETAGGVFIMEHEHLTKGGPYRHVHPAQDEWLYAMAGEFRVEIGDQKLTLTPGDSVLMPRKVPHVWAQVDDSPGKLLIAFTPAGRMEEFFRDFGKTGKLPSDPEVVRSYGLERVGPPLAL